MDELDRPPFLRVIMKSVFAGVQTLKVIDLHAEYLRAATTGKPHLLTNLL